MSWCSRGAAKDSVSIDVQQGSFVIGGERKASAPDAEAGTRFRRVETAYGPFSRTFRLPETGAAPASEAGLPDGVLRVLRPFDRKKTTRHHIEVR
ncbi:Hsp20/alpha crystallin family protein [Hymenobacter algoricola]|uniref:SHSP domain-containing protein n=1 Tax=Hymenobacter algoricola TaxID=486267 RepID=A0ABP7MHT3_9BACT